jgi:RHS repeat-associated protein
VDVLGNWQRQVTEERVADRLRIERATSNGSAGEAVTVYHGGLMVEQRRPADTVSTRMSYDALDRLISSKQPHHAHASSTVYTTGKNQVISRSDATGAVTSYGYFPQGSLGAGRVANVTYADATVRRSAYDIRGNMTNEWGSATAPTSYGFDGYNQLETLSTYRTAIMADSVLFPATIGTPDVTTWVRQEATGLLTQKKYADNQGPVYLYDIAGRITRRTLARGSVTDYTYTAWGQPDVTNYADATPDADIDYDRMGRKTRESNGTATSTYQYSATTLRPTLETITYDLNGDGTPELTRQLDRSHDNLRRPTGFTLKDGATTETAASYGYDPYSRLSQISNPQISNQIFTYSYLQNSNLLAQVTGPVHTVTNTWEPDRDVLDAKENKVGAVSVSKLDYSVNAIGQRTALSQTGTAFASVRGIAWAYDSYGQVTSADSTLATQDRAYQYDAIGNRKKSATSLTLPATDNYTSNSLNQYSSLQQGGTGVSPVYDLDGNATSYPLATAPNTNSTLTWDGENRMTSTTVNGITTTQQFDATGRRISKTTGTTTRLYLYEGWNVIAEYSRSVGVSPTLQKTYLWGTDLSGTLQGAGGVGGLLLITDHSALLTSYYPTYDGNGNISEYLTATGAIAAHFEYDPFGNTTINTDSSNQFTYKFSTKPQDVETGLYYYGYRYYDAKLGRWPSRDPIQETGGMNVYGIVNNDLIGQIDVLGEGPIKEIPDWHHLIPDSLLNYLQRRGIDINRNDAIWGRLFPDGHYFDGPHRRWFSEMLKFKGSSRDDLKNYIDNLISNDPEFKAWYKNTIPADMSHPDWKKLPRGDKLLKVGKVLGVAGLVIGAVSAQDLYNKYRRAGFTPVQAAIMAGISSLPVDIFEEVYKEYEDEPLDQICWMLSPGGSKYLIKVIDVVHMMNLSGAGWRVCSCQ